MEGTKETKDISRKIDIKTKHYVLITTIGVFFGYFVIAGIFSNSNFTNITYAKTSEGVYITCDTEDMSLTKVEYGTSPLYVNNSVEISADDSIHRSYISGLLPGKAHYFRLVGEDSKGNSHTSKFFVVK